MNNSERIFEAMGQIDDRFIAEIEDLKPQAKKKKLLTAISLAACFAICAVSTALILPKYLKSPDDITGDKDLDFYKYHTSEDFLDSSSLNLSFNGQTMQDAVMVEKVVSVIQDNKFHSYSSSRVIDPELVGDRIGEVWVRTCRRNYVTNTDNEVTHLRADMYKIKGIGDDVAIALKYKDSVEYLTTTHYYTFVNTSLSVSSLSELYSKLSSPSYLSFSEKLNFRYRAENNETDYSARKITSSLALEDALLALDGEALVIDEDLKKNILVNCDTQLYLNASLSCFSTSAIILDNGYMIVTAGRLFVFDIGKDRAKAFIDLALSSSEEITYSPNETVTQTTKS